MTAAEGAGPAPLTGARTLWELVARRASLTPEHAMLLEPDGEELTFGEFARRCEVVAAGMAELGVGEGTVVSWQLPTRVDTVVLSMALARLGAIQTRSCTCTASARSASHCARRTPSCSVCPGCGAVRTSPRWPNVRSKAPTGHPRCWSSTVDCPRGTPSASPRSRGIRRRGIPGALDLLHVGSTAEPKGVRHTDQTLLAGAGVSPEPLR